VLQVRYKPCAHKSERMEYIARQSATEPALLRTCKQTHMEASKLYYETNFFALEVRELDISNACRRLRSIVSYGMKELEVTLHLVKQRVDRLENAVQLAQVLAETGLRLKAPSVPPSRTVLSPADSRLCVNIVGLLEEAVEMGQKGYEEGWSAEAVEDECLMWMEGKDLSGKKRKGE